MIKIFFIAIISFSTTQLYCQDKVDSLIIEFTKWRSDTTDCMYYKDSLYQKLNINPSSKSTLFKLKRKNIKAILGLPDKKSIFSYEYLIIEKHNCSSRKPPLKFNVIFFLGRVRSISVYI